MTARIDIPERTFRHCLRQLLEREFLYEILVDGIYFVNITYMFNGDRLAFVPMIKRLAYFEIFQSSAALRQLTELALSKKLSFSVAASLGLPQETGNTSRQAACRTYKRAGADSSRPGTSCRAFLPACELLADMSGTLHKASPKDAFASSMLAAHEEKHRRI